MYNRIFSITIFLSLVVVLGSCKKSEPTEPVKSTSYVSFLDKGAVVPQPVSTLVTVDQEDIIFVSSQNGVTISSWSAKIQSQEYNHMISLINNNKLVGAPDPTGSSLCVGAQALIIVIKEDNITDTLNIAGVYRCDKSCWPMGLDSLVAFKDSLVDKYKP
ncbi:MAG: hypothetical protein ABSB78_04195 [Bacteroidota bacterium]